MFGEAAMDKLFISSLEIKKSQAFKGYHYSVIRTKGKTFNFDGKEWKWKDKCDRGFGKAFE